MKPISLRLEGFACFRDRTEIDFSSLDLFAISGVTGAGKTSIIDAMTFALYGATPRLGERRTGELIHLSSNRARVLFEFAAGDRLYRIARTIQRSNSSIVSRRHLERYVAGDWISLASRDRDLREKVKEILGLDFGGFNRSIVLPQGQFDQFLKGNPRKRRKILSDLLQLEVYERMGKLARQRQREFDGKLEVLDQQLQTRLAKTEEKRIARLNRTTEELVERSSTIRQDLTKLSGVDQLLLQTALERERKNHLGGRVESLQLRHADLRDNLAQKEAAQDRANDTRVGLEDQRRCLAYDEEFHLKLQTFIPRVEDLERLHKQRDEVKGKLADLRQQLEASHGLRERLDREQASLKAELEKCADGILDVREELTTLERDSRGDMAAVLRGGLVVGEACPVCAQTVIPFPTLTESLGRIPEKGQQRQRLRGAGTSTAGLEATVSRMEALKFLIHEEMKSQSDLHTKLGKLEQARLQARLERSFVQQSEAACRGQLRRTQADVTHFELDLGKWSDGQALRAVLEEQEQHRSNFQDITRQLLLQDQAIINTQERAEVTRNRLFETRNQLKDYRQRLLDVEGSIATRDEEFELLMVGMQLTPEKDPVSSLEKRRSGLETKLTETSAELGRMRERLAAARKLEREVGQLQKQRDKYLRERELVRQVALDLRASDLVSFIQEEALSQLAEDSSSHFHHLSSGRFRFILKQGEFCVVDYWNGEEIRPAATLSGGESFLASLSLALALSESLTSYASTARKLQLESLFLDEGFSTLDPETLDLVVEGIEALAAGQRMIGVVSHLPQIARRLPGRIQVTKSADGSSVTVI